MTTEVGVLLLSTHNHFRTKVLRHATTSILLSLAPHLPSPTPHTHPYPRNQSPTLSQLVDHAPLLLTPHPSLPRTSPPHHHHNHPHADRSDAQANTLLSLMHHIHFLLTALGGTPLPTQHAPHHITIHEMALQTYSLHHLVHYTCSHQWDVPSTMMN